MMHGKPKWQQVSAWEFAKGHCPECRTTSLRRYFLQDGSVEVRCSNPVAEMPPRHEATRS